MENYADKMLALYCDSYKVDFYLAIHCAFFLATVLTVQGV